jgi:hypothetical protein
MKSVKITLAVGAVICTAMVAYALTRSPPTVVRAAVAPESGALGSTSGEPTICQANELLPRNVTGVRFGVWAFFGSTVHMAAYSNSRLVTQGSRDAAWTSTSVTIPVKQLDHATPNTRICLAFGPNSEPMILLGGRVPGKAGAVVYEHSPNPKDGPIEGRINIEYLSTGKGSWWSRALTVARHIGLGHFVGGTWLGLLIAALMAAVGVLAIRLTSRDIT